MRREAHYTVEFAAYYCMADADGKRFTNRMDSSHFQSLVGMRKGLSGLRALLCGVLGTSLGFRFVGSFGAETLLRPRLLAPAFAVEHGS